MLCKNQQKHKLTRNTCSVNQFKYSKVIEEYVFLFTYPSINLTLKIFCCVFFMYVKFMMDINCDFESHFLFGSNIK